MNRLQAARAIKYGLTITFSNGDSRHLQTAYLEKDDEVTDTRLILSQNPHTKVWTQMSFKEVLRVLRWNFPKQHNDQCTHKYEMWDEKGRNRIGHARCVLHREHFHCKSCGDAEVATGLYSRLCAKCTEESDTVRRDITQQMMEYQERFGIPFKRDEEVAARYSEDSEGGTGRIYREDFHADG